MKHLNPRPGIHRPHGHQPFHPDELEFMEFEDLSYDGEDDYGLYEEEVDFADPHGTDVRRSIEEHLERRRLRQMLEDYSDDDLDLDDD